MFGSYAYVLPDVIAFGRYYPSIRSCIDCLIAMVDVNKVFPDKKPVEWMGIVHTPETVTVTVENREKPGTYEPVTTYWHPLIKPPPDDLVWRPVLIFLSVFIISFRSSNTLVLLIRWQRPSMMGTNPSLRPSLR